ncbi:MAG: acetyltransferase [Gammaproteobacteria bacterium]|nr:acetyltransferase [Gammaproteobacteria bacterium]
MSKIYGVFGASGFGREVMPVLRAQFSQESQSAFVFVDDNPIADEINGHRVLTFDQFVADQAETKLVSVAIADSQVRKKLVQRCSDAALAFVDISHAGNVIMDDVEIEAGSILTPFVTITSNVRIGKQFHANIYSYVAHDCVIGDYVTFAPRVMCNGNVHIHDYAYIGTGAILKQGKPGKPLVIGEGAVVGMGAVVTKDVAPGAVVVGNPAKPLVK